MTIQTEYNLRYVNPNKLLYTLIENKSFLNLIILL